VHFTAAPLDNILIDVSKRKETLAFVLLVFVPPAAQVAREQLLSFLDIVLVDHALDWRLHSFRLHGVELAKRKAEEPVATALGELWGKLGGELYGLIFYAKTAKGDVFGANDSGCAGAVAVPDPPGGAQLFLPGG